MEIGASQSTPLLGNNQRSNVVFTRYLRKAATEYCSVKSWKRRFPISTWLPKYTFSFFLQDIVAGLTVGLTSIPQGIAYAIIAGLPPQYGLYSSLFPGIVYMVLGSCKNVIIGPTAILALLVSKYVSYSIDFAILISFLSGCIILLLGLLNLGFLMDFISKPVISGFTAAAALQIAASQLIPLFRVTGSSGSTFLNAIINFFNNINTCKLWDPILGFGTIFVLVMLKRIPTSNEDTGSLWRRVLSKSMLILVRARNAMVVAWGATFAYCLHEPGHSDPFVLIGKIHGGLPEFGPPPFSTVVGNQTYQFPDMLRVLGPETLLLPLIAVLETIAIAKAFAFDARVDKTQELVALGASNLIGSFCRSMPTAGSFTRTTLNHASGVATPAGGLFKGLLVLLALIQLTSGFQYIPRATLAAVIMVAMASLLRVDTAPRLWKHSKQEFCVYMLTLLVGLTAGLEYGILVGVSSDMMRLLHRTSKPLLRIEYFKVGNHSCVSVLPVGRLSYSCAEYFTNKILDHSDQHTVIVIDGRQLHSVDVEVAEDLITVILDLENKGKRVLLWKFSQRLQKVFENLETRLMENFINTSSIDGSILSFIATELRSPPVDNIRT